MTSRAIIMARGGMSWGPMKSAGRRAQGEQAALRCEALRDGFSVRLGGRGKREMVLRGENPKLQACPVPGHPQSSPGGLLRMFQSTGAWMPL